jgi:hypothetical protein
MDGRIQLPVIQFLKKRFQVKYVDVITEPGPNLILAVKSPEHLVDSIFHRLQISVDCHHSVGIAIVGHSDCAGNPKKKEKQIEQIRDAIVTIRNRYNEIEIIGLWVDENWEVKELPHENTC